MNSMVWSPEGRYLATKMEDTPTLIWIWDTNRLSLKALLVHSAPVRTFAWADASRSSRQPFSPSHHHLPGGETADDEKEITGVDDGPRLAVATADRGLIFFWSLHSASIVHCEGTLRGGPVSVTSRFEWSQNAEKLFFQDKDVAWVCSLRGSPAKVSS